MARNSGLVPRAGQLAISFFIPACTTALLVTTGQDNHFDEGLGRKQGKQYRARFNHFNRHQGTVGKSLPQPCVTAWILQVVFCMLAHCIAKQSTDMVADMKGNTPT